jgi:hypothetical protein
MKNKLIEVYIPVLDKIYTEVNKIDIKERNYVIPDIFVPGVGKSYSRAYKKILFVGIDTNGWYSINESACKYKSETDVTKKRELLEGIISRASNDLKYNEHIDKWWGNGTSKFWDYIFKLQIYINNFKVLEKGECFINGTSKLRKEWLEGQKEVTQNFAWANTKLLQELNLDKNIMESYFYNKISEFVYKKKEDRFEVFKLMIESLQPDIIIILNWNEYLDFIGNYEETSTYHSECKVIDGHKELCKEMIKIEYYRLVSGQHVFWTYHPTATVFRGGVDIWVKSMYEFMKDKKVI